MDWDQEKKAALDMLVECGVDFDTASKLVLEKVAVLGLAVGTVAGAVAAPEGHRGAGAMGGLAGGLLGGAAGSLVGSALKSPKLASSLRLGGAIGGGMGLGKSLGDSAASKAKRQASKKAMQEKTAAELSTWDKLYGGASDHAHIRAAKRHGKEVDNRGIMKKIGDSQAESFRALGRGVAEGAVVGTAASMGASALAARAIKRGATTMHRGRTFTAGLTTAGALAGYLHGSAKSVMKNAVKLDKHYQEKKAALDLLIDQGLDFDTASDLVMAKADELYGK